jgi:tRNA(Ile)-lysidine synthase TilS/MesJ
MQPAPEAQHACTPTALSLDALSTTQRCTRCILPTEYPKVDFDESGECAYCRRWTAKWNDIDFGAQSAALDSILGKYRGAVRPYDCLVGMSGGKDSVYAAYILKQRGMHPLACTFDNGFLTDDARHNIASAVEELGIGHVFVHPDADVMHKLYRHFLLSAGEFCSVCNVGIRSALYRTARENGIRLIVSGQSNRTEANSPKEFFTCSNGYFANVARSAISRRQIMDYMQVSQIGRVAKHVTRKAVFLQLPSYLPWVEEDFKRELAARVGWRGAVGVQHADCLMSEAKEYLKLRKFGVTEYTAKLSSLVRDGQLTRAEALERVRSQAEALGAQGPEIEALIRQTFSLSEGEYQQALGASHLPYLSKTDARIASIKNLYERARYRRARAS